MIRIFLSIAIISLILLLAIFISLAVTVRKKGRRYTYQKSKNMVPFNRFLAAMLAIGIIGSVASPFFESDKKTTQVEQLNHKKEADKAKEKKEDTDKKKKDAQSDKKKKKHKKKEESSSSSEESGVRVASSEQSKSSSEEIRKESSSSETKSQSSRKQSTGSNSQSRGSRNNTVPSNGNASQTSEPKATLTPTTTPAAENNGAGEGNLTSLTESQTENKAPAPQEEPGDQTAQE